MTRDIVSVHCTTWLITSFLFLTILGVVEAGLAVAVLPDTGSAAVVPRDTTLFSEQDSPKSWEIVKSMVYGGLVESITSLGIVTSAASGDATTCKKAVDLYSFETTEQIIRITSSLESQGYSFGKMVRHSIFFYFAVNIVALALANLIGGLFVIAHNVSNSFVLTC